jgi:hypothetical protein
MMNAKNQEKNHAVVMRDFLQNAAHLLEQECGYVIWRFLQKVVVKNMGFKLNGKGVGLG